MKYSFNLGAGLISFFRFTLRKIGEEMNERKLAMNENQLNPVSLWSLVPVRSLERLICKSITGKSGPNDRDLWLYLWQKIMVIKAVLKLIDWKAWKALFTRNLFVSECWLLLHGSKKMKRIFFSFFALWIGSHWITISGAPSAKRRSRWFWEKAWDWEPLMKNFPEWWRKKVSRVKVNFRYRKAFRKNFHSTFKCAAAAFKQTLKYPSESFTFCKQNHWSNQISISFSNLSFTLDSLDVRSEWTRFECRHRW